ncbi:MAG: N-acetyl-alpha-D-glucosaminyl L-malate synthase BshA [Phycisphaera sp.]|nr:N-acetyl-alpha-D-glucosaminyl L-malate synthase BshA [Phycisphaera sp.]
MKIAISCHPTQGGSGVVATELAMGLAERGHEVHLVSMEKPFRLPDSSSVVYHSVPVTDYPLFKHPPHDLSLANKLAEVTVQHDIDVIHAHYAVPHAVSAILASKAAAPNHVKVVTTLHGTDITLVGSHRDFYRVCRWAMLECDGLTAVSQWLTDETVKAFALDTPPAIIPNFVDRARFTDVGRVALPDSGEVQIMHASNFRPVKRVFDVIRVFHRIQEQRPARLIMVGDGPMRGMTEELVAELGIVDRVNFVGPQKNIEDLYRRSHLFILPSDYESFGLSALEAMACGTPVVASRAGGLVEVIDHGVTGHLCPVGHIDRFADCALAILANPEAWSAMSAAASRVAMERFCKDKILAQYEAFYDQVVAAPVA